jgi:hypothetical protein
MKQNETGSEMTASHKITQVSGPPYLAHELPGHGLDKEQGN